MERRELLRYLAAGAGVSCIEGLTPEQLIAFGRSVHERAATGGHEGSTPVLDAHANATVIAAAERIIPKTDTPGATDAMVHAFIDRMLADWYTPAERERVLDGLRELDERARSRHARDFVSSADAEQAALLETFDDEVTALRSPDAARRRARLGITTANEHWFALLKYLTVWGYFTSEVGARALGVHPLPGRYDGCAPYPPRAPAGEPAPAAR